MRKVYTLILMLVVAMLAGSAWAQQPVSATMPVQQSGSGVADAQLALVQPRPISTSDLKAVSGDASVARQRAKAARKAVASIDDLTGNYVMTYKSLTTQLGDGGSSVTITKVTDDTVLIANFWTLNVNVKAKVDLQTKTITIPNQVAVVNNTYGDCDICAVNPGDGKPDRTKDVTGTIADDGTLNIDTWWGIYVKSGESADQFMVAAYGTQVTKANAKMDVTYYEDSNPASSWNVIVEQTGKNIVAVTNFGNHGKTVEIKLNNDSSFTISPQLAWEGGTTQGNFYTYAANWEGSGTYGGAITGKGTANELSWGQWVMFSTNNYYTGKMQEARIYGDGIKFEFPTLSATEFEGEGTEANPFKIKILDDLTLLASMVNNDTELNYGGPVIFYTRSLMGKYFRIENDIDMAGYRFDPIGNNWSHRFAGVLDGNGHKLSNLDVSTGSTGYAGLIGYGDTLMVVKNLIMENVNVRSAGYDAGGVVGITLGRVENCQVTGTVSNDGVGTGGVAGVATDVVNCSFEGTINGLGGVTGGVVGEAYNSVENCYAIANIVVSGPSDTYTGGGVAATLYGRSTTQLARMTNCYFSGMVDGTRKSNLFLGGVVGQVYRGYVDGCFAVANVYGFDSEAQVGGVVGSLAGEIHNSYATGYVQSTGSRKAGGITGAVKSWVVQTSSTTVDTLQSTIKNSYFSGRLRAETYMYKPDEEVRETLGTIMTGATPTIENIYFDKQMVDLTSTHYGALTSELTKASGPDGFPADKWVFTEGYYPRLKGLEDNDAAKQGASVIVFDTEFPDNTNYVSVDAKLNVMGDTKAYLYKDGALYLTGYCGSIEGDTYKLNKEFGTDTIVFYNLQNTKIAPRMYPIKVSPKFFDGAGKEDNPFQIKTKADLMLLGHLTTNLDLHFTGVYFKQMNDIDMENDSTFTGICCRLTDQSQNRFEGHYDGGGHTIHNMWLYYVAWKTPPTETSLGTPATGTGTKSSIYKGFIGYMVDGASIKNLTLASDCQFDLWGYAGAFVGYNYGLVENCKNFATLRSYSSTLGGIVGNNNKTGVVRNCLNGGRVTTGWMTVGGIVGNNSGGTIENCMNVGIVESSQLSTFQSATSRFKQAGGIVGTSNGGVFRNVVNAGHVSAPGGVAAGIAGNYSSTATGPSDYYTGSNDAYQVIDYGTVFSTDPATMGSIGGNGTSPSAEYKNIYYDKQVSGLQAAANSAHPNMQSVTTAELISGKALDGFDTDLWQFTAGEYPVLKAFASEPMVIAAARAVATMDANETANQLKSNISLAGEGISWKLAQNTDFTLSGATVNVPANVTALVCDTLTATSGDYVKPIALRAVPAIPLTGEGTEQDPFQISNTGEWNAFADYMALTQNSFDGKFVKVMNDIDFTDVAFKRIAGDGVTGLSGTLLGNGKTVKGITWTPAGTYEGAINLINSTGTVKDLTLEGNVSSTKGFTAGFAGKVYGTLDNCVNNINVSGTVAGVGGFSALAGSSAVFNKCVNNGTITGDKGTVAGFAPTSENGTQFIDCVNNGTITNVTSGNNVGGLVGSAVGATFIRCANKAEIKNEKGAQTGGIAGYVSTTSAVTFLDCYNEAPVTAGSGVAGILGLTPTSLSAQLPPLTIVRCYNTGDITSLLSATYGTAGIAGCITPKSLIRDTYNEGAIISTKAVYTGGIWGYSMSASTEADRARAINCYNTGGVIGQNYGAGIGGVANSYFTIDSCYNTAEVSAVLGACGIANVLNRDVVFSNCWNAGDIATSKQNAGGINGYGNYNFEMSNCFNVGNVTAAESTGFNAGGLSGTGRGSYYNCYNRGTVSAPKGAGGLVGSPSPYNSLTQPGTAFYGCYNAGIVVQGDTTCGSIIGDTGIKCWDPSKENRIEDTYYVTDFGTFEQDTIGGTPVTIAQLAALSAIKRAPARAAQQDNAAWNYGDAYTLPVLNGFGDNDAARAHAAAVVLQENDTYDSVSGFVHLGLPEGAQWSCSTEAMTISGDHASATTSEQQEVTLTVTVGDFSRSWVIKLNGALTAIDDNVAAKPIVAERYFNVAGLQVNKDRLEPGQVYIVVRTYGDGTSEAVKVVK